MALCDEKCTSGHTVSVLSQVCLQFSSRVVRHGFHVKSCCGLPGHERKKNSVVYARSSGTVAEQNQTAARVPGLWTSSAGRKVTLHKALSQWRNRPVQTTTA